MSFVNNLIASSASASSKINEFNFTCSYNEPIVLPKSVSLSRCVITNTLFTFRPSQISLFLSAGGSSVVNEYKITNGYYDTISEFLTTINAMSIFSTIGLSFSFSTLYECLKITSSQSSFVVKGFQYTPSNNICKRLGFNLTQDYLSFTEGAYNVVYASSPIKLLRTTGFYLCSNLTTIMTASPSDGLSAIIDFIPIQSNALKYGDLICISNNQISKDIPIVSDQRRHNMVANSAFVFQLLDDEMQSINDTNKDQNTILFLNFDYN